MDKTGSIVKNRFISSTLLFCLLTLLTACGGDSGGSSTSSQPSVASPTGGGATATYNLTTSISSGSATGTISRNPAGTSCGTGCDTYNSGTSVTLTAVSATGYTFSGWSGSGVSCPGTGTCTVSMSANRTVTATFSQNAASSYTLNVALSGSGTVTSSPAGISCGADCSQSYTSGTSVTLTAVSANGYALSGWSGNGVSCPGNSTCTVSMSANSNVIATFISTTNSAGVCDGLVTDKLAHPMTALARPARLQAVTDPQFGTTIRRITDVKNDGRGANNVLKPVYSTVSAWNVDESRLILYRTDGAAATHELYDGKTYAFIRKLDDIAPADLEQIYWDTSDPDILYYVNRTSRQMIRYHISTKAKDVLHDFSSICSTDLHGGTDPMFTSWDSKTIGLICGSKIFSYNLATNTVNTQITLATGNNAPQAAPSGTRFFLNESDNNGTVRDINMNVLLTLNMANSGEHSSMSRLSNGHDTFNQVAFDGTDVGSLVQHDMVTGAVRVIVGPSTGYPYPPSGEHVTGMSFKRTGLVAVSVKGNLNGSGLLDSELLLVDTDPATNPSGEVCRIGHHRTASDDYWAEPHPVLSPSGTRLLFGSSWGNTGVIVDSYVVELPSYTP